VAEALEWNRPEALRAIEAAVGAGSLNHVGSGAAGGLDPDVRAAFEARWGQTLVRLGYAVQGVR
jgi:hypothetical protein